MKNGVNLDRLIGDENNIYIDMNFDLIDQLHNYIHNLSDRNIDILYFKLPRILYKEIILKQERLQLIKHPGINVAKIQNAEIWNSPNENILIKIVDNLGERWIECEDWNITPSSP